MFLGDDIEFARFEERKAGVTRSAVTMGDRRDIKPCLNRKSTALDFERSRP